MGCKKKKKKKKKITSFSTYKAKGESCSQEWVT